MSAVSEYDWGLAYGYGLFETVSLYRGVPFLLHQHVDRMLTSAGELGFETVPSRGELMDRVHAFCRDRHSPEGVIRFTLTYGNPEAEVRPALFFTERPVGYTKADYVTGIPVGLATTIRNERSPLVRHKTLNQMESLLAWRDAVRRGFRETLLFNTQGYLAEGTRSNVFIVKDGNVYTPSVGCGILAGITRNIVNGLLKRAGLPVREELITRDDLLACDECFLTNSVMAVLPVNRIEDRRLVGSMPGEVTGLAAASYEDEIHLQCRRAQENGKEPTREFLR